MLNPHRRFNPLTREWVLVSPHRTDRPWQGQVEDAPAAKSPAYDPDCYLCPGNMRAGGVFNPPYTSTFVFTNDFAALKPDTPHGRSERAGLLVAESEPGICRVVCFSPRHNLTIANMEPADLRMVVDTWVEQYGELGARDSINYVQIFENRGAMMGASNPHPHGQIWATEHIPDEPLAEVANQRGYTWLHNSCLLCDVLKLELEQRPRIVCENEEFVSLVPFWAVWPFETLLLSRAHLGSLKEFSTAQQKGLADILKQQTSIYDRMFATSFPYTMGFHQRPTDGEQYSELHFHGHFYPPLLRSATVRKFMVGFEMLGMPQRDITPEAAAQQLRSASVR
jgi:UDPglucose--hexose-1-phosphate uridylyltransferase